LLLAKKYIAFIFVDTLILFNASSGTILDVVNTKLCVVYCSVSVGPRIISSEMHPGHMSLCLCGVQKAHFIILRHFISLILIW